MTDAHRAFAPCLFGTASGVPACPARAGPVPDGPVPDGPAPAGSWSTRGAPCHMARYSAGWLLDNIVGEPGIDSVIASTPRVRVDRLALEARQRRQRLQRVHARQDGPVKGVAGRVARLHELLALGRKHE